MTRSELLSELMRQAECLTSDASILRRLEFKFSVTPTRLLYDVYSMNAMRELVCACKARWEGQEFPAPRSPVT
jgi:hypothetical protein